MSVSVCWSYLPPWCGPACSPAVLQEAPDILLPCRPQPLPACYLPDWDAHDTACTPTQPLLWSMLILTFFFPNTLCSLIFYVKKWKLTKISFPYWSLRSVNCFSRLDISSRHSILLLSQSSSSISRTWWKNKQTSTHAHTRTCTHSLLGYVFDSQ